MKAVLKRLLAMIIDMFIVIIITTLVLQIPLNITTKNYNKDLDNYQNIYKEYTELMQKLSDVYSDSKITGKEVKNLRKYKRLDKYLDKYYEDKKITKKEYTNIIISISNDYSDLYQRASFKIQRDLCFRNVVSILILALYFVVTSIIFKGQTIGKKIFKLRVVNEDGKDAKIWQIFVRTLLNTGLIVLILELILLLASNYKTYNDVLGYALVIYAIFEIVSLALIMYREDKRGLHDLIARTKVVRKE